MLMPRPVEHHQRARQGAVAGRGHPAAHPQRAFAPTPGRGRAGLALFLGPEGQVGVATQAGMPVQGPDPAPEPGAVQPPVAQHMDFPARRHRRGQEVQQTAQEVHPRERGLCGHQAPGHRQGRLVEHHAHRQGHQSVRLVGGIHGQYQGRQSLRTRRCHPGQDPGQQRGEAGLHVQFLVRSPGLRPLRIVLGPSHSRRRSVWTLPPSAASAVATRSRQPFPASSVPCSHRTRLSASGPGGSGRRARSNSRILYHDRHRRMTTLAAWGGCVTPPLYPRTTMRRTSFHGLATLPGTVGPPRYIYLSTGGPWRPPAG